MPVPRVAGYRPRFLRTSFTSSKTPTAPPTKPKVAGSGAAGIAVTEPNAGLVKPRSTAALQKKKRKAQDRVM
jgi:hypothetical protein